uniref:Uncharacterized protein n=1 Tax=Candidozyma auris TaxID=498019 RepID=A0A0L0P8S3_CANAR
MVTATYDTRPREERDFKEVYPDLDDTQRLRVVIVDHRDASPTPAAAAAPVPPQASASVASNTRPVFVRRLRHSLRAPPRMLKALIEHGFRPFYKAPPKALRTYIREHAINKDKVDKVDKIDKSDPKTKKTEDSAGWGAPKSTIVRYDLDEQDDLFLNWRNGLASAKIHLSREVFELAITALEEAWHRLEARMGGMGGDDHEEVALDESFDKYGNDDGIAGAGLMLEQRCAVCNDSEGHSGNAIVFCDGCNIAVHQECYGIAFIPEGQWFCRRCMLVRGRTVECSFCPSRLGAFKQLDNGLWSHVVCALWIPEVYFANPIYMEPIEGVGHVPKTRWKLVCYICKQRVGCCIQCTNRLCFLAYHVTCAKRAGLYMAMEKGVHGALALKATLTSFCHRHSPPEWSAEAAVVGIAKTRRFYRDRALASEENHRLAFRRRLENSTSAFKWRTEQNTPIAPRKFVDMVVELLLALKVDAQQQSDSQTSLLRGLGHGANVPRLEVLTDIRVASAQLCKYWCLKREAKRGAPLVSPGADKSMLVAQAALVHDRGDAALAQLQEKIDFGHTLVADLEKVVEITRLAWQRQAVAQEISQLQLSACETAYFPMCTVAKAHLTHMTEKLDPSRGVTFFKPKSATMLGFWQILKKVQLLQYNSAKALNSDVESLLQEICSEHSTGALGRAATKWLAYWRSKAEEIQAAEHGDALRIPFVKVLGAHMELKQHDAGSVLEEENLSEVETEPAKDPLAEGQNRQMFRKFLGGF